MQFWSGTAFMQTSETLAVARMFDEAGYDGIVCSDHLIYPRELASPDLYKRAEDFGITAVMCAPWAGMDLQAGGPARFREPIERFAETIIEMVG
jgi:dihydrodipicolinate synthase/N-acetylneuraminate lyase